MRPPRTVLALGLAGLCTAGLGGGVLTAQAVVRTFDVTLSDGRVLQVTVDVPPETPVTAIDFPGVDEAQIVAVDEHPAPAPAVTTPTPPPAPEPKAEPDPPSGGGEPVPAGDGASSGGGEGEPRTAGSGRRQETTNGSTADADAVHNATGLEPSRKKDGDADGGAGGDGPAVNDPTTSIAIPGAAPIGVPNFFIDKFRIPPFLLSIYQAAGIEYGVRWEVLAAINEIETDYGRNLNVSSAGALGWMQFMPATWRQYGVDANGDGRKDPYNPVDAIFAAARYLRAAGADKDLARAVFAYNHADWYVDSVLMRARLIGGLPMDLVGSLTGLTQGRFPVAAEARYADDIEARAAQRRVAKGTNAAVPIEADATRRDISIYARAGSRAVAVQDGTVVRRGHDDALGNFVVLRDAFGNTYTYSQLGTLASRHPVLKSRRGPGSAGMYAHPPRDPAPTQAASAGEQTEAKTPKTAATSRTRRPVKERLFAHPRRKAARGSGGAAQLPATPRSQRALLGLPADQVTVKPLRKGSRVAGGTVLGHIGSSGRVVFAIRPAGRGAPQIDPKPILDGWKLLETTALYRARQRNPFFGPDARTPSIGQILLMGKGELERRVLANPRIEIYDCGRLDVKASRIDRRVLATLEFLAASGLRPTVTSLTCGHSFYTASGNVSHHSYGSAVDIAKVNGIPIVGHQGAGSITDIAIRRLLTLQGTMRPSQIISLMKYESADNTLAMGDHADHIHVGFTPLGSTKAGKQLAAVLKPGQWIKLIDRIGEIDNPAVAARPSSSSVTVVPSGRASRRHRGE